MPATISNIRSTIDLYVKYSRLSPDRTGNGDVKTIAVNVASDSAVFITIWGQRFGSAHIQLERESDRNRWIPSVNMSGFCGDHSPDAVLDFCDYAQRVANLAHHLAIRLGLDDLLELHSPSV